MTQLLVVGLLLGFASVLFDVAYLSFLPALVRRDGYDIRYVDVVDRERKVGASHYGFWGRLAVGIPDLLGVWWLILRRRRVPQAEEVLSDAH